MLATQLDAYRTVQKTTDSGRELEASVLCLAAMKLTDCQKNWGAEDRDSRLNEALEHNQRIWTILQSELAKADNPLPQRIKDDLLSLSIFVDKRTFDIMAFPVQEKLSMLININLNIAAGLRGSAGT
ncbi:MAG: flagellar biosynthesis regulator FlaF [Nitrospirae bacterium]|nr:flagellar biosynthesis regulator FlaF [Nitrospirota bacterium]